MAAILVLLLAALSRLLPHTLHGVGLNFTAVGGGLLYFGASARRGRGLHLPAWSAALLAVLVMGATDVYLTTVVFGMRFQFSSYLVTWTWYAAVCLLGSGLLARITVARVAAAVIASATSFFVISNLMVWLGGGLYSHSLAGLGTCYAAALPFYGNDLASTALTAGACFGLPVLAARLVHSFDRVHTA